MPAIDHQGVNGDITLSGHSRLCLRLEAKFDTLNPSNVIETDMEKFTFEGLSPESFTRVLKLLDGCRTVAGIAACLGLPEHTVMLFCDHLTRLGIAVKVIESDPPIISAAQFFAICGRVFPIWKKRVFSHPLWISLASGKLNRSQFIGWLLETYHFIETVNSRMTLAVAECRVYSARKIFIHHYTEEWNHHHFFLKSLQELGFDKDFVFASRPLPGTLAVVNCMRNAARRDPLYYAACSGFLESTGDDRVAGRQFFELLTQHYCPDNSGVIQPMRAHLDLDEEYGHNGMLQAICPYLEPLTSSRISEALQFVLHLVETLELWSSDILKNYADEDSLRRRVRLYRPMPGGTLNTHLNQIGGVA